MSELAENEGEGFPGLPDAAPATTHEVDTQPEEDAPQAGRDFAPYVDLSDLPEEKRGAIEARFKHISGQTKREVDRVRREWQEIAAAQSEQIEKLTNGFSTVASQIHEKTYADTEAQLTAAADAAFESGDMRAYREAERKLGDLRVQRGIEQALAEREKAQPKKEQRPQQALAEAEPSPEAQAWQDETDDMGVPLRPWTQPDDPGYRQAYTELLAIKSNPRMARYSESQIMQELDKRMGTTTAKPAARQNVLGGNLTRGAKPGKVALHPKAEEIAVRMKLGGPKATREQHLQAYFKAQLEEAKRKGTRQ